MSTRERYIKVIESLVNGQEAEASDLLHEAFVEKAREIWNDLVEADEVIEDKVAEEDIDEAIGDEKADDFIDDIEEDDDEIEAEEMYGEDDEGDDAPEGELSEPEAEMELSVDDGADDLDGDGEIDDHEGDHAEIEDKLVNVEDALADLKAEFAKIMGDDVPAEEPAMEPDMEMEPEMDMEMEPEMEETAVVEDTKSKEDSKEDSKEEVEETKAEEADEKSEEIEEGAELKAAPVSMPAGDDGKASPVGPGDNKQGGTTVDMSKKSGDGSKKGLTGDAKDMNVTGPQEAGDLKANPAGHGAEKKGKAE